MTKKWLVALSVAAAMALSSGAIAQATVPNFYAGLEIGQADFGAEDDTAIKILGGYQFHRNIAAELAVARLLDKGGTEVTAVELVGVGLFPVAPQFSLLAKFGLANVDVERRGGSSDNTELTLGIGVQFDFSRNLGARVQWQRYDTDDEIDLLSVGAIWRF